MKRTHIRVTLVFSAIALAFMFQNCGQMKSSLGGESSELSQSANGNLPGGGSPAPIATPMPSPGGAPVAPTAPAILKNIWLPFPANAATPIGRRYQSTVWTGSKMIVLGGDNFGRLLGDGEAFDPVTQTWSAISMVNGPPPLSFHMAVWTGSKMLVWNHTTTVYAYDPATNTWSQVSSPTAPTNPNVLTGGTAVWTGSRMIFWGYGTGWSYDPVANTWTQISNVGAPSYRMENLAVWTGSKMLIWGGRSGNLDYNDGAMYDPATNTWAPMPASPLSPRSSPAAAWTGSQLIVWAGWNVAGVQQPSDGAIFDMASGTWNALNTVGAPVTRYMASTVWTGNEMIVWGGIATAGAGPPLPNDGGFFQ
jgi:hypothetical protein